VRQIPHVNHNQEGNIHGKVRLKVVVKMVDANGKKLVWFPSPKHGFAIGRLIDIKQTKVTVEPIAWPSASSIEYEISSDNEKKQHQEFAYKQVYPYDNFDEKGLKDLTIKRQFQLCDDVDDSCALIQLNEAALLENVRLRFHRDKIYTYVAHILIAANPYFQIPHLHSSDAIARYQGKSLGTLPPHVYAIGKSHRKVRQIFRGKRGA